MFDFISSFFRMERKTLLSLTPPSLLLVTNSYKRVSVQAAVRAIGTFCRAGSRHRSCRLSASSAARSRGFIKKLYRVAIYPKSELPTSCFQQKSVFNIMNIQASLVMREPGIYYICANVAGM